ncbi:MAG: hypothetical protein IJI44_03945 [Erysipelotrichaceae bacterium]|nr:hypothetical protein [Erysipelotrichaceae bacterium]
MKYGESLFDILYLLFVIISGSVMLKKAGRSIDKQMGLASLILGCGDAFHLVPRVLNYFVDGDYTAALGIGKLITSITMTVFYLLMYRIYLEYYQEKENGKTNRILYTLLFCRILLCLLPQNGWLSNSGNMTWGIIRNLPFVLIGGIICCLYYRKRKEKVLFRFVWLYVLLSFLFYIPVAVGAGKLPILGMLMLPKTVCYILLVICFLRVFQAGKGTGK